MPAVPGAVTMIVAVTATLFTSSGGSAWFIGALLLFHPCSIRHNILYGSAGIALTGLMSSPEASTQWARHASEFPPLCRCLGGRHFMCAAQHDGANADAIPL